MSSSLDIIDTDDDKFKENYDDIMVKIKKKTLEEYEPKIDEINKIYNIITEYIKEKKRKIYGGYALNKLLIAKNKSYAIYDEFDNPDIDFYSPDPIDDMVEICDRLFKAGLKDVTGQEAQHKETYSIFVNQNGPYCDISYMPNNIYSKVRFIQQDGYNITHPWFIMIDFFRMFSDPIISYWRLEKHFARYLKLQKAYPLPLINKPLHIQPYSNPKISETINRLFDYIANKNSIIFTGFYVYNYYLNYSNYQKDNKSYEYIYMPYLEMYSSEYISDGLDLLDFIKNLPEELKSKISYTENFPFYQFYGFNTVIYFIDGEERIPVLYLYSNNKKCLPYKEVEYIKFDNLSKGKPVLDNTRSVKIGCFDLNILHALIILVKVRVDDDNDWNDTLYKMINGYVHFRNYYLKKKNKTLYDETIFQGFVLECIGETMAPDREMRLVRKARKKLGKPMVFRYSPGENKKPGKYIFLNSSGNKINKDVYLKLTDKNKNKDLLEEYEDEEKDHEEEDKTEDKTEDTESEN